MSKMTKRWLSIVTTLAVAFVMTFGCMGEVFAVEGDQIDGEQAAVEEQADAEEAVAEEGQTEVSVLGEDPAPGEDATEVDSLQVMVVDAENNQQVAKTFYYHQGEGGSVGEYLYYKDDGGNEVAVENTTVSKYSSVNNFGNANVDEDAVGPTIEELLRVAGVTEYENGTIGFQTAKDALPITFTAKEFFGDRYYFPNIRQTNEMGDNGAAVNEDEMSDAVSVPAIINLKNEKKDSQLMFGQQSPNERNNPPFYNGMALTGSKIIINPSDTIDRAPAVTGLAIVEVENGAIVSSEEITEDTVVKVGDKIGFLPDTYGIVGTSQDKVYYTVDGTKPDIYSSIYNWYYKKKDKSIQVEPIEVTKPGEMTIKAMTKSYGKKNSAVQTFTVDVNASLDSEEATATISDTSFTGSRVTPEPVVAIGGINLVKGKDYRVAYSNNISVGKATCKIIGMGSITGTKTVEFTVKPAKPSISASSKYSRITVKVTNSTGAAKYKIQYKRSGTSKWTTKSTTSKTYKTAKLRKGKYYYVRVLPMDSTGKIYGSYSATKKIRVR